MCGRYLLRNAPSNVDMTWREYYERIQVQFTLPRFNICPSQKCIVLRYLDSEVICGQLAWGFKPRWSSYQPSINARAEGLFESKMFKGSVLSKRCLVIADGFYEPEGPSSVKKRPWHLFEYDDKRVFAIAGIWTESGFAIITNNANAQVKNIHERMPHILNADKWSPWLNSDLKDETELKALLEPETYPGLTHYAVDDYVKKPGNEGEHCIAPLRTGLFE